MENNILRNKIKQYLIELGFNPSLKGFKFWTTAILYAVIQEKNNEEMMKFTELYKFVGKCHKATASKVERDMRYILEKINLDDIFGTNYSITNSAFLFISQEKILSDVS